MKTIQNIRALIIAVMFIMIILQQSFSQEMVCSRKSNYHPENDCDECVLNEQYNVIVKNIMNVNQLNKMEEELHRLVQISSVYFRSHGNLKMRYFNDLELDMKKIFDACNNDPDKLWDAYRDEIVRFQQEGCMPKAKFDGRTDGVADRGLQNVADGIGRSMQNVNHRFYGKPGGFSLDCCDLYNRPDDIYLTAVTNVNEQIEQVKKYFENFALLHEINLQSVQFAAMNYQQFDANTRAQMERLRNNSLAQVVSNSLVQAGIVSQQQMDAINNAINTYNDVVSLQNAISNIAGDDAAELFGAILGDMSIADLRGNFGDLLKNNPSKLKNLQKLNDKIPSKPEWFGTFMNAVQIAEMTVNVAFDTFLKLGGDAPVREAANNWWCLAEWNYHCALTSLLANAAAFYQLKQAMQRLQSFVPNLVIPMGAPAPESVQEAIQRVSAITGTTVQGGTLQGNKFTVNLPDNKQVVFIFGNYFCGKLSPRPDSETTPDPKQRKKGYDVLWQPQMPFFAGIEGSIQFNNDNADFFELNNFSDFDSAAQEEITASFEAVLVNNNGEISVTHNTGWNIGITGGYGFGKRYEVRGKIEFGKFSFDATIPVKVVRVIPPPSPSAPPSTQQSDEYLSATGSITNIDGQVLTRVYFTNKIRLFSEAGAIAGSCLVSKIVYTTPTSEIAYSIKQSAFYAGGIVTAGVNIPVGNAVSIEVSGGTKLLSVKNQFVVAPVVNAGIRFGF